MSPKQYKSLERAVEAFLVTVVVSGTALLLLGVYAFAIWVF